MYEDPRQTARLARTLKAAATGDPFFADDDEADAWMRVARTAVAELTSKRTLDLRRTYRDAP